jgi:hypothetical protein
MDDFRNKVIVKRSRVKFENICHRVTRLFLQSSELGLPHPLTRRQVCPSPFGSGWGTHSLAGEGLGDPNYNEGTDTVVLWALYICAL